MTEQRQTAIAAWGVQGDAPATNTRGASDEELLRRLANVRVLLVEDDALSRDVAMDLLAAAAMTVETACNGGEALDKARNSTYGMVLMDLQMPGMDGIQATRAIRGLPAWSRIPILAVTANVDVETRRACSDAGIDEVIAKPIEPALLYEAMLRWIGTPQRVLPATASASGDARGDAHSRLQALADLNLGQGLAVVRGDADKYMNLLRKLLQGHLQDMQQTLRLLDEGKVEDARRVVHNLKGVSSTLGVEGVRRPATEMNDLLRADPENLDNRRLLALMAEVDRSLTTLDTALRERA